MEKIDGKEGEKKIMMFPSSFYAFLDQNGCISVADNGGMRQIGVTIEKFNEVKQIADEATKKAEEYYKKLADAGLVQPVLSTEEQVQNLSQQVQQMSTLLAKLLENQTLQAESVKGQGNGSTEPGKIIASC